MESNAFAAICRELAVLYSEAPVIRCSGQAPETVAVLAELLRRSGLWGLMQRVQRYALGLREMLVRVDVERGRLVFRPVYPDLVWADPREDRPDQPVTVRELRLRDFDGKQAWTWDVLSVADESNPVYQIREALQGGAVGKDLTAHYFPDEERSGKSYPYRRTDGTPVLPYVLYHSEQTGDRLWDPYTWAELVDSAIGLSVKYNMLDHVFITASWPQRYVVGAAVAGGEADANGKRREVLVDPAIIVHFEKDEGYEGQPVIGQFQPGGDVDKMEAVLASMAARIATEAGVPASDIQRMNSQRSGVSISLTNEGKRGQQRRFAQHFRDGDERMIALAAALLNRATEAAGGVAVLPEAGWEVAYQELPLSPDELAARRIDVIERLERGLLSRVGAYQELNPGLSRAAAIEELKAIDAERAATATASMTSGGQGQ